MCNGTIYIKIKISRLVFRMLSSLHYKYGKSKCTRVTGTDGYLRRVVTLTAADSKVVFGDVVGWHMLLAMEDPSWRWDGKRRNK